MPEDKKPKPSPLVPPNLIRMLDNMDKTGNIYSLDPEERGAWADFMDVQELIPSTTTPEVVFFVGCVYSYDPKLMQVTADTVRLLSAAKVPFVVLNEKESCCGAALFINGAKEDAKKFAKKNSDAINHYNAKYVITSCPACYRNLKFLYPEIGYPLTGKILHTVEYLDLLVWEKRLKLTRPVNKTVSYHDPCELGRLSGLYRPPRRILEQIPGLKFVEIPDHNMDRARCCGGGGAVKAVYPQLSDKMAEIRLWDIDDGKLNLEVLATCCPQCEANLDSAVKRTQKPYKVLDIASLMVMALPSETT